MGAVASITAYMSVDRIRAGLAALSKPDGTVDTKNSISCCSTRATAAASTQPTGPSDPRDLELQGDDKQHVLNAGRVDQKNAWVNLETRAINGDVQGRVRTLFDHIRA